MEHEDIKKMTHNQCVNKMLEIIEENVSKISNMDYKMFLECLGQVRCEIKGYVKLNYFHTQYVGDFEFHTIRHKTKIFKLVTMETDIKKEWKISDKLYNDLNGKKFTDWCDSHDGLSPRMSFFNKYNKKFLEAFKRKTLFTNWEDYSDIIKERYRNSDNLIPEDIGLIFYSFITGGNQGASWCDPEDEYKTIQILSVDDDVS